MVKNPPSFVLFGVPFHDVTFAEAVAWAMARMRQGRPACIATANLDFLMQSWCDPELHRILLEADLVIADGWPIVWASRRFGPALRERVTGSDLTPMLAAACARENRSVFLLGGGPGVAGKAAAALCARYPGLRVAGCYSPPLADVLDMDHDDLRRRLREAAPDLLLVAFGAPKQEKFINLNLRHWSVPVAMGVGGTLDFLAGVQQRAPVLVQRLHLEWLWRMATNPRRLFRRYAGNMVFLWRALRTLQPLAQAGRRVDQGRTDPDAWGPQPVTTGNETVLDTNGWGMLDSRELGMLVAAAQEARRAGRRVRLTGVTPTLAAFLHACRLDDYLGLDAPSVAVAPAGRDGGLVCAYGLVIITLPAELTAAGIATWQARCAAVDFPSGAAVQVRAHDLAFLDSAGVGWLAGLRKRCQDEGRPFASAGFSGRSLQTLRLARLEGVFAPDDATS